MRKFLFFFFCAIGYSASSQDLTGIWRGSFYSNSTRMMEILGIDDRYKFEVQLDQHNKDFNGVTYSYKTTVFYGKASCKGKVSLITKKVYLEELKIVQLRRAGGVACIMTCFLQYNKIGDVEYLQGTYISNNVLDSSNCGGGTIFLRRVTTSDFYKEPFLVKREKEKPYKKDNQPLAKNTPPPRNPGNGVIKKKVIIKKLKLLSEKS